MNTVDPTSQQIIARLKRIEGQLRGIQAMIERQEDCEPVAQQLAAARKALDKTFFHTLACALQQAPAGDAAASQRIIQLLERYA